MFFARDVKININYAVCIILSQAQAHANNLLFVQTLDSVNRTHISLCFFTRKHFVESCTNMQFLE